MTTISLPADLEAPLSEQAQRRGTTVESLAVESLREIFVAKSTTPPTAEKGSLYDLLAEHIGAISGSSEALSEDCGKRFNDGLVEKQQRGHL